MGENHWASLPVALYGVVLFMCAIAYLIMMHVLIRHEGRDYRLTDVYGNVVKSIIS